MNRYARQEMIAGWNQALIVDARILVIGAGTTGNEVIKNLALLGFGAVTIIDFDDVEAVNLSRSVLFRERDLGQSKALVAARMAKELNPAIDARGIHGNVVCGYGNLGFRDVDCVILTVDNLEARMWVNRYCWMFGTPLINTGISGLNGNVSVLFPRDTACLECSWTPAQYQRIDERYSCLKVGLDPLDPKIPMVISTAAVIGGIAAQEAVSIAANPLDRIARHIAYSGETQSWLTSQPQRTESCLGHPSVAIPDDSRCWIDVDRNEDVREAQTKLARSLGASVVQIQTDKAMVRSVACRDCSAISQIAPEWLAAFVRRRCVVCGGFAAPLEETFTLSGDFTFAEASIPENQLLSIAFDRDGSVQEAWIRISSSA